MDKWEGKIRAKFLSKVQMALRKLSQSVGGRSKEEGWLRRSQEIGNELRMENPRRPCEMRESLRQVERAQGEVRRPKCQRKEG